ncbi:MAG TPA: NAD(P)/FAD-dependent oxidoreductase [Candidatus Sulfopaludibacter sp.]|nr:NAD(P)/FAD-dependent oxidoreductase [Candidatus Sulfopaludibacter sp.]
MASPDYSRAAVIGSGPNGLAAAILLARAGIAVTVYEAAAEIGGGTRSAELTLPGFLHDVCSAVHPMAACSPCFEQFPLAEFGLEWIHPGAPLAHPLDDGTAVMLERSIADTAANLGHDAASWGGLMQPLAGNWTELRHDILAPLGIPRHPFLMANFGRHALRSARGLADSVFRGPRARALFAGIAAHAIIPLEDSPSAAAGLVLGAAAHAAGWPLPRGGSRQIASALAACLRSLGGQIVTNARVESLPTEPLVFCDVGPRQFLQLAAGKLPNAYRDSLTRYRYGPGVFKLDIALDGPIPWRAPECLRAGTVHLGGTFDEIARWEATHMGAPFVLVAQQSLFDPSRAPAGKHTVWAYCHVPNGSTGDFTAAIEDQIERFAPGFRARILARHTLTPAELEARNQNLVGGDIGGGAMDLVQTFLRPNRHQYRTPVPGVYLCSSSTPPGGGVHGMCGYHAVKAALG